MNSLKYIVEVMYMTNCELIVVNGHGNFNLKLLKTKIWVLQISLSILAALVGGVQFSFNKGFTICLGLENGLELPDTYIYIIIVGMGAIT